MTGGVFWEAGISTQDFNQGGLVGPTPVEGRGGGRMEWKGKLSWDAVPVTFSVVIPSIILVSGRLFKIIPQWNKGEAELDVNQPVIVFGCLEGDVTLEKEGFFFFFSQVEAFPKEGSQGKPFWKHF